MSHSRFVPIVLIVISSLCIGLWSCSSQPRRSPNEKRFDFKGKVVSVDKAGKSLTIAHEDIKDYMPAMTMPFAVKDDWVFDVVVPGDQVTALYIVDGTKSWLEEVVLAKESSGSTDLVPGERVEAKPGDEVPNYRLVNQDNKAIRIHDYKGKVLLITFIFSRCQDPDQCTLMSSNFATVDQQLQKQSELYDKTHLLSISFDPEYDTPQVLRSYGGAYTGKYTDETFAHWEFASGSADEVKGIAQFFGLRYYKDSASGKEQVIHSLRTSVIGPDSKIVKVYRGNDWKPEEVLKDVQALLTMTK